MLAAKQTLMVAFKCPKGADFHLSVFWELHTYLKLEEPGEEKGSSPMPVAFRSQPLFCLVTKNTIKGMYNSEGWPFPVPPAWLGAELPRGKEPGCSIPSSVQVHVQLYVSQLLISEELFSLRVECTWGALLNQATGKLLCGHVIFK